MIIKSISAENFGKFDRYSVNLDDNINVFYGDNEAGKTTLLKKLFPGALYITLDDFDFLEILKKISVINVVYSNC